MRLEIGAGARAHDGYVAVDINPAHADIVADAQNLPFEDGTVTAIRAVDVLEHCSYRDTHLVLAEWARVCAAHADLYVQVPDAAEIFRWYTTGDPRICRMDTGRCTPIEGATWRLLGGQADGRYVDEEGDFRWNAHYALFDRSHLTRSLEQAGFEVSSVLTNAHPNLCASARRR